MRKRILIPTWTAYRKFKDLTTRVADLEETVLDMKIAMMEYPLPKKRKVTNTWQVVKVPKPGKTK